MILLSNCIISNLGDVSTDGENAMVPKKHVGSSNQVTDHRTQIFWIEYPISR